MGMGLARRPALLLLDEPLAQLDAPLRLQLRAELRRLQRRLGLTVLHVTHDQAEALALADRLAVLHAGELQQVGTPDEVYRRPANVFVAQFVGVPP
jgi:ABC-type sugar transport system ATPase subunit